VTYDELVTLLLRSARPLDVVGNGALARRLRDDLDPEGGDAPATIVETTGADAELRAALSRVAKVGTVVLAGPPPLEDPALDLYVDVHARGLTVIGVSPPSLPDGAPSP
jgi:threonine dehydrogenase-like Zn-dependent dehydrogenase